LGDAEAVIKKMYGDAYTEGPRRYKTKSANAQEAHEAIRPTEVARTPESLSNVLDRDGLRLYELIWKRTLASQMADAKVLRTAVEIESLLTDGPHGARTATFNASGKQISFPGYLRAYVEGSDDPDAEMADKEVILPALAQDESIDPTAIEARGHETQPPARYTEASLVKKLEAEGIGRPSTYASIIDTIQYRNYVVKQGNALIPTFTAFCVTQLLEDHFADYVDLKFTARMEQSLDDISNGELDWREHLAAFYNGNGTANSGLVQRVQNAEPNIDYPAVEIGRHPETGEVVLAKVGRYGPYVQLGTSNGSASADEAADGSDTSAPSSKTSSKKSSKKSAKKSAKKGGKKTSATSATSDDRIIASLPNDVAPADLTVEEALDLIRRKQEGPRCVGQHPDSGLPIYILTGRFGPYLQEGETPEGKKAAKPKRASIPKGMSEDAVTLEQAVLLLSLPRTLGTHPETGEEVIAAKGRFGAYLKCGSESRSLRGQHDADVYTISLEEALPILKEPKKGAARRRQRTVLSDLGKDKSGRAVEILDGPYGPYVTNGEVNASLPDGVSPEEMTLDRAVRHLAENGKAPKRGRSRAKK
jgi:DNA topoisomerase-1